MVQCSASAFSSAVMPRAQVNPACANPYIFRYCSYLVERHLLQPLFFLICCRPLPLFHSHFSMIRLSWAFFKVRREKPARRSCSYRGRNKTPDSPPIGKNACQAKFLVFIVAFCFCKGVILVTCHTCEFQKVVYRHIHTRSHFVPCKAPVVHRAFAVSAVNKE